MSTSDEPSGSFTVLDEVSLPRTSDLDNLSDDLSQLTSFDDGWFDCAITTKDKGPTETSELVLPTASPKQFTNLPMDDQSFQKVHALVSYNPMSSNTTPILKRHRRRQEHSNRSTNFSNKTKPPNYMADDSSTRHKICYTVVLTLFVLLLALGYSSIQQMYENAKLYENIIQLRLQHTEEMLNLSKAHAMADQDSVKLVNWIQLEKHQLLNDLQSHTVKNSQRDIGTQNMILDLQKERHKLLDVISDMKHQDKGCSKLKSKNTYLHEQQAELIRELRNVKLALIDLKEQTVRIPGMRFLNRLVCRVLRYCPDL